MNGNVTMERAKECLKNQLLQYITFNEQEEKDLLSILEYLNSDENLFTRDNTKVHLSSSAWVLNSNWIDVLMVHHNIYNSWVFPGGHVEEFQEDLIETAIREVKEETGVNVVNVLSKEIFAIQIIPISSHFKNGKWVDSHIHIDIAYLLQADENEILKSQNEENSEVKWFKLDKVLSVIEDEWFRDNVFKKLAVKTLFMKEVTDENGNITAVFDNDVYSSEFYEG